MSGRHSEWIDFAENDLAFAEIGIREKFYSQACFHAQQSIEKSLKGYLVFRKKNYPKTHKLVDLYSECKAPFLTPYLEDIKLIDEFYIPTRYPDGIPGGLPDGLPNEKDARLAVGVAEDILKEVRKKMKG